MAMTRCASCNQARLKRGKGELRRAVDGVMFEATLPAAVCGACGEAYFDASVIARFELGIADALANMGRCTPDAFRFMRKTLGFSGLALAQQLGVEPETVSRWENGARGLDRGAFALLGGLVADRIEGREGTIKRLNAMRAPAKAPKRPLKVDLPKSA
jgi:putative zinc finger/helix-turn-helix YgiT family protein